MPGARQDCPARVLAPQRGAPRPLSFGSVTIFMAIDDPAFERALQQLRMEELGTAPGLARILPKIGLSASKAIQALLEGSLLEAISSFGEVHEALGEDRSLYLLFCLNEDLKRLRNRVNEFTHKQEEYLRTDFIGLMFDADRKAQETRSQSRIKRILSKTFKDGNARRACVTASFPIVFEAIVTA